MSKNKLAISRLTRFVAMLKENCYPNHPKLVREMRKLDIAGAYSITQKTLQRDVAFLCGEYNAPIKYDYHKRGYYLTDSSWSWNVPQLKSSDISMVMVASHLAYSIMPSPFATQAQKTIDALMANSIAIENSSGMLERLAACGAEVTINPEIFSTVFDCWMSCKILQINYVRAMDGKSSELIIEPQVLAFYEGCWYMRIKLRHASNKSFAEKSIITIALHRITHAIKLDSCFVPDEQIINDAKVHKIFDFPLLKEIKLSISQNVLNFAMEQFKYEIQENISQGKTIVSINHVPEYKIRKLVFDYPLDITVLEPEYLRKKIAEYADNLLKNHQS